jgi:outer membrane biosynthesis protein TonB
MESPRPPSDAAPPGPPGSTGNSDIRQPEMSNPDGSAGLTGDVSLSTTDWVYAPWLQRFGRELMRRWIAPPAYNMGLLKDGGFAVINVEITRSGKVLRVDLLEKQGHPSLILAAHGAVRSMAPVEPLPADFPDQTLILRIRMVYPKSTAPRR